MGLSNDSNVFFIPEQIGEVLDGVRLCDTYSVGAAGTTASLLGTVELWRMTSMTAVDCDRQLQVGGGR